MERTQIIPLQAAEGLGEGAAMARAPLLRFYGPLVYLAMRMRAGEYPQAPSPDALRLQLLRQLDSARQWVRAAGVDERTAELGDYALTALLDDTILASSTPLRDAWERRSLQGERYRSHTGGERFFEVLEQARRDPRSGTPLLELLYWCLVAGFGGKHRSQPEELQRLAEDTAAELLRRAPPPVQLSPRVEVSAPPPAAPAPAGPPPWMVLSVAVGFVVLLAVALGAVVGSQARRAAAEVQGLAGPAEPAR